MTSFWTYFIGTCIKPRSTFTRLLSEPRRMALALGSALLMGVLYTLTTVGNAAAGAQPLMPPLVAIPSESYYFWETFFMIPVYVVGWMLAAGIAQALGKLFGGSGNFGETLSVFGFALNIPWYITWMADSIIALLYLSGSMTQAEWKGLIEEPGLWQIATYSYPLLSLVWLFALVAIAVSVVHRLRRWQTLLITTVTVIVLQIVMLIFIR